MKVCYKILYGSDVYGTTTNDSDRDIRGILLPTVKESLSLKELKDIIEMKHDENGKCIEDTVMFPIQKYFRLALKSNPSVIEWLFVPNNDCLLHMDQAGKIIRDNRLMFLSKEIYHRFKGFAYQEFTELTKLTAKTGAKRKEQILKFGYSPKNAMNCIRLLQQGTELLNTANLTMPRPNWQELIYIKKGNLRYEDIVKLFDAEIENLKKAYETTLLPEETRFDDANELMIRIIKDFGNE